MSDYRSVMYPEGERMFIYSMGYEDRPALAHWGPGSRNYCILHYVTAGKGYFCGHEVRSGQGFYIHSSQAHEYHADKGSDGWNYFWIIFSEELAKRYVLPNIEIDEDGIFEADFVQNLLIEKQRIFSRRTPMRHMESLGHFFSVMALHERKQPAPESLPLLHIRSAKALIESRFGERLSVRETARELHIDDRYLYNLFRKYEGITPKEYIDRCTVENACRLLTQGGMSITQTAQMLGFDDVCTFSKFFKKKTGVSPLAYRQRGK